MKHFLTLRLRLATAFFVLASLFFIVGLSDLLAGNGRSNALKGKPAPNAAPGSGQLNPTGGTQSWAGATAGPISISLDESTCVDGQNCDTYLLTLNGNASDWAGKKARVTISWPANGDDFDVFIHKTNNSGALVGSAAASGAGPEIVELDPSVVGVGVFSVHVVYFSAVLGDSYSGLAEVVTTGGPTPTPTASPSPGMTPTPTPGVPGQARFHTFNSPQGYGDDSGEPSIGVNWLSEKSFTNNNIVTGAVNPAIPNGGTSLYYGGFLSYMLKVTFDDCSSPAHALWEQKPVTLPAAPRVFGDPILFTDHETGRTFVAQELGLSPGGSTTGVHR